jgi:hypothetical protein
MMKMIEKSDCEKCDTAEMMVELKKRGYVVIDKKDYEKLIPFI